MGPIEEGPAALSPIAVSDFDGFVIRRHDYVKVRGSKLKRE